MMRSLDEVRELMRAKLSARGISNSQAISRRTHINKAPLSFAQRSIWVVQHRSPTEVGYNLCLIIDFDGIVDEDALVKAFSDLVERHEVLRTTYFLDDTGEPWQVIHDDLPPQINRRGSVSGAGNNEFVTPEQVEEIARAECVVPFDIENEGPLRVTLVHSNKDHLYMVLVIQHIVWDGMTMNILSRDLEAAYRKHIGATPQESTPAIAPDRQVADFAEWEVNHVNEEDGEYWRSVFADDVPKLDLRLRWGTTALDNVGERSDEVLPEASAKSLENIANSQSVTQFAVFLTAYHLMLMRMTGQRDIVIGTTVANRELEGTDKLIGNFSNQLPLRIDATGVKTFGQLVRRVSEVIAESFKRKSYPYERIAAASNIDRSNGESLFNTMVLFLQRGIAGPQLPTARSSWQLIDSGRALYPLATEVFVHPDRVDVQMTYRPDYLSPELVSRMQAYLADILSNASADLPLGNLLTLIDADERLISASSRGKQVPVLANNVDTMIRLATLKQPDELAVIAHDGNLTWRDFDRRVNQLARMLLQQGCGPNERIAVMAQRDSRLPCVVAAILRAGGIYLPLDSSQPDERLSLLLTDCEPKMLILSGVKREVVGSLGINVVDLADEATRDDLARFSDEELLPAELVREIAPSDGVYMVYTSGTTGMPKGVINHHVGVATHLEWMGRTFAHSAPRCLQKAPISFDVGVGEILTTLGIGACLVVPDPEWLPSDVATMTDLVERHNVTILSLVPSLLRGLIAYLGDEKGRMPSVRYLVLGGEAVPPDLVRQSWELLDCRVYGLYGPTEAAMDVAYIEFSPELLDSGRQLIGKAEDNCILHVLDEALNPVPVGVPGELFLSGVQVASGYFRRPELTAASFLANPFQENDLDTRLYRTGDLVMWCDDGELQFLGRIGDQVKIRGNRVELGEIDSIISTLTGIRSGACAVKGSDPNRYLVGYYVADSGVSISGEELINCLRERLPEYMIPVGFQRLNELPLNANGKLDRKKLPDLDLLLDLEDSLPCDAIENTVAQAFVEALGLAGDTKLGRTSDCLMLGGDSISAIKISAVLRTRGFTVSTGEIFEGKTVQAIARAAASNVSDDVYQAQEVRKFPLPPIARNLLAASPNGGELCQASVFIAPPQFYLSDATDLVERLTDTHPVLAARLVYGSDGTPSFEIPEDTMSSAQTTEVVVTEDWADVNVKGLFQDLIDEKSAELSPADGHNIAAVLIRSKDGNICRLLLVIHHLVVDGVSWRTINDELRALDQLRSSDQLDSVSLADENPAVDWGFGQWCQKLSEYASTQEILTELPEWETIAERASFAARPIDPSRDVAGQLIEKQVLLNSSLTEELMGEVCATLSCGLQDLQLAALVYSVVRWRMQEQVPVGSVGLNVESHGRIGGPADLVDIANSVGWYTTAYPIAIAGSKTADLEETLHEVRAALRAVPGRGQGWGLLRWLNTESTQTLTQYTLPEISFNYLGRYQLESGSVEESPWDLAREFGVMGGHRSDNLPVPALIDINTVLLANQEGANISASFRYIPSKISQQEIDFLIASWEETLGEFVALTEANSKKRKSPADYTQPGISYSESKRWLARYGAVTDVLPMVAMQEGLYLNSVSSGGASGYVTQTRMTLQGELDQERLSRAVDRLLVEHSNLSIAGTVTESGLPVGVVVSGASVPVTVIDLRGQQDQAGQLVEIIASDEGITFDLEKPPLMRATIIKLEQQRTTLLLTCHHLLSDGWSGQLIAVALFNNYLNDSEQIAEGGKTVFAEFSEQLQQRKPEIVAAWRKRIADLEPSLVSPFRTARVDVATETRTVDEATALGLAKVSANAGVTINVACQLAWARTLAWLTGQSRVVFGEVVSGRSAQLPGLDTSIGCYANTLPGIVDVSPELTWLEALRKLRDDRATVAGLEHYPLTDAISSLKVRKLFDTTYVFQSYPSTSNELDTILAACGLVEIRESFAAGGTTDDTIMLMVFPADSVLAANGIVCHFSFATEVFDTDQIRIIEDVYLNCLTAIVENGSARIKDTGLVDQFDEMLMSSLR